MLKNKIIIFLMFTAYMSSSFAVEFSVSFTKCLELMRSTNENDINSILDILNITDPSHRKKIINALKKRDQRIKERMNRFGFRQR